MSGVMFDRAELLTLMPEDGTYLFVGNEFIKQSATRGYEIGWDVMAEEYMQRPKAWVEDGSRVGRWTNGTEIIFDRVMYVDAPREIAITIAEEFNQQAVWSWETSAVIEVRS